MSKSVSLYVFFCTLFCTIIVAGNLLFQKFIILEFLSLKFELSVGVLFYPATFLISDLVTEFYGVKNANFMLKLSVLCSITVLGLILIGDSFSATSWSNINDKDFHRVFSVYGIASIGSIIATFFAQVLDVWIFSRLKILTSSKHLWLRNNVSTILGQILDTTLVLAVLCFSQILSWEHYYFIAVNSIAFKIIAALADTPFCYAGHYLIEKYLGSEPSAELTYT